MATTDPYILFQGAGGVTPAQNAAMTVSLSRLAMDQKTRAIQDAQAQVALQQAQKQQQYEQNLADVLGKVSRGELGTMSPDEVAAQGGSPATPTAVTPNGTPTLATPPNPSDTPESAGSSSPVSASVGPPPTSSTTVIPPAQVQPGVGVLPGPGGVNASGVPIQQISPNTQPQDRPSIGEMIGPVDSGSVSTSPPSATGVGGFTENLPNGQPAPGTAGSVPSTPVPAAPALTPVSPPQTPAPITRPPSLASSTIDWVGPVRDEMIKRGFAPQALAWEQAITKHINDQRLQNANVTEQEMKATIARHKQADEELTAFIKGTPQALQAQQWPAFINSQVQKHNLTADEAAQYRQFPGTTQLPVLHTYLRGQTQINEDVLHQNQAREADIRARAEESRLKGEDLKNFQAEREDVASQLSEAKTKEDYARVYSQIDNPRIRATFPPPESFDPSATPDRVLRSGMTMEQKLKMQEAQKNPTTQSLYLKASGNDPKKALELEMADKIRLAKASKTVVNVGAEQPSIEANAQMIANYQTAPLSGFVMRSPEGRAIMARVSEINPEYHAQNFNAYNAMERDATSGKMATSANALNTMMGHLDVLDRAATALHNKDLLVLNRIGNYFGVQTGKSPVTVYDAIVHRIGPEVTKAYVASGGSVGERGTNEADFSAKLSPKQIHDNIAISAKLADSKIKALQDQYNRGTYGRGKQQLISEEAEATRQRLAGGKPQQVVVIAPDGSKYPFETQALADQFKKLAGIK